MKITRCHFFLNTCLCILMSNYVYANPNIAEVNNVAQNNVEQKKGVEQKHENITKTKVIPTEQIWVDRWQRQLTQTFNLQAQTIDNWFIDAPNNKSNAGASGKIRFGWEPRTRNIGEFDTRFKIKFSLPSLTNKVDLLLSDDEDDALENQVKISREIENRAQSTTLALRFYSPRFKNVSYRIGAGRRDQVFARATYRNLHSFSQQTNLLYDTQLNYYNRDYFGAEVGASLLYEHDGQKLDKLKHRWYYSDKHNEFKWHVEAQRYYRLDLQSTLVFTTFVQGKTQPNAHTEQVYMSAKLRSNPMRKWLFFEFEPFVLWLDKEGFEPSYGLALRFEAFYGEGARYQF